MFKVNNNVSNVPAVNFEHVIAGRAGGKKWVNEVYLRNVFRIL